MGPDGEVGLIVPDIVELAGSEGLDQFKSFCLTRKVDGVVGCEDPVEKAEI